MKKMPTISKFMTPMPQTIEADTSIKRALSLMGEFRIRHLPVMSGGNLVGIITDRDVKLATSFKGADEMVVSDVMARDPYTVLPEAPLGLVVLEMAESKYGSAIVRQENGKIVGIFTANDGLRVLGDQLGAFYKNEFADGEVRA